MIALGAALNLDYKQMVDHWTKDDVRPPRPARKTR
jgi:hypothetical protein